MDNDHLMDPRENPLEGDHLPVAGEVGVGPASYHDPVTQPTDDEPDEPQSGDDSTPGTEGTIAGS